MNHREKAGQQVDTGGDHRRRVDQRRNRRRPFHRIRQPDMQRELRRLAHRARDQTKTEQRHRGLADHQAIEREHARLGAAVGERIDRGNVHRAGAAVDQDQRRQHSQVAQSSDQERLLRRGCSRWSMEPESDQQVRGQTDQLPEGEQHQQVVGQDQAQHGSREQRHEGEIAPVAVIAVHIAGRIDLHQQRHPGHDDQHHRGQTVDTHT